MGWVPCGRTWHITHPHRLYTKQPAKPDAISSPAQTPCGPFPAQSGLLPGPARSGGHAPRKHTRGLRGPDAVLAAAHVSRARAAPRPRAPEVPPSASLPHVTPPSGRSPPCGARMWEAAGGGGLAHNEPRPSQPRGWGRLHNTRQPSGPGGGDRRRPPCARLPTPARARPAANWRRPPVPQAAHPRRRVDLPIRSVPLARLVRQNGPARPTPGGLLLPHAAAPRG